MCEPFLSSSGPLVCRIQLELPKGAGLVAAITTAQPELTKAVPAEQAKATSGTACGARWIDAGGGAPVDITDSPSAAHRVMVVRGYVDVCTMRSACRQRRVFLCTEDPPIVLSAGCTEV